jgi:hypothetical protein
MRIERIVTKQGHPVPSKAHRPNGPFPPEVLAQPKVIHEYDRQDDGDGSSIPLGSTAQNKFNELRWYVCNDCGEKLPETKLEVHICGQ